MENKHPIQIVTQLEAFSLSFSFFPPLSSLGTPTLIPMLNAEPTSLSLRELGRTKEQLGEADKA
jgi:hypothetical protein